MLISDTGYWQGCDSPNHHHECPRLKGGILNIIRKGETVSDLGCGLGGYTKALNEGGRPCTGYDGNPMTENIPNCKVWDLTTPMWMEFEPTDWVLSLEVGEHIPASHRATYITNLHRMNVKGIILSWAIPGQGGDGHVSELPNSDIIQTFGAMGYDYDAGESAYLRGLASLWWFKQTIMVFRK